MNSNITARICTAVGFRHILAYTEEPSGTTVRATRAVQKTEMLFPEQATCAIEASATDSYWPNPTKPQRPRRAKTPKQAKARKHQRNARKKNRK